MKQGRPAAVGASADGVAATGGFAGWQTSLAAAVPAREKADAAIKSPRNKSPRNY